MPDDRVKTPRTLLIADHLWEALSTMAVEMGGERDALVNQALYTFARLNGFLVPADLKRLSGAPESSRPRPMPAPPPPPPVASDVEDRAAPSRPPANPERMAEIAQQLSASMPAPRAAPTNPPPISSAPLVQVDDTLLGDDSGHATNMELPNLSELGGKTPAAPFKPPRPAGDEGTESASGAKVLVLLADGRELDRVVKDRFLIGRGKHCDLIINSGKVSREHAAITREGATYFIEDLGSSNGTWFDKRRITRRQIQEGDEYFICSEKLTCSFR